MRDKSHEHRKIKDPHPKSQLLTKETHEKGFEQIEEAFSELEKRR